LFSSFRNSPAQSLSQVGGFNESVSRSLKLTVLNTLVRPARHLENSDAVSFAEQQVDLALAKVTREALNSTGLKAKMSDNSFGQLHYYDSHPDSNEPPVVLLHGIGSSGQCFSMLALMMLNKRRVVMPDLFHFSGFSKPNNPVMSLEQHTQAVVEFVRSLSEEPADVVGLSLGGWIAMKLAIQEPQLVKSLSLLNPGGLKYRAHTLRDTLLYLSWNKFHSIYPGIMSVYPYSGIPMISPVLKRGLYRVLKSESVRDFVKTIKTKDFVDDQIDRIQCPVQLLWGVEDKLLSTETPLAIVKALPNCQAYWVREAAHILCLEAPVNVYECLVRFLQVDHIEDNNFVTMVRGLHRIYPMQAIGLKEAEHI
jgi:abhydrolase domain-containing protein 6